MDVVIGVAIFAGGFVLGALAILALAWSAHQRQMRARGLEMRGTQVREVSPGKARAWFERPKLTVWENPGKPILVRDLQEARDVLPVYPPIDFGPGCRRALGAA